MDDEAFYRALAVCGDPSTAKDIRKQAEEWLLKLQERTEAWSFADRILHSTAANQEAMFWAAQTLKMKVHKDFEELPAEAAPALRESLALLMAQFCKGPSLIRKQLALALAATVTVMPSEHWGAPPGSLGGGNPVRWLAERFNREAPDVAVPSILELMAELPHEIGSMRICCHPRQRQAAVRDLRAALPDALAVLSTCASMGGGGSKQQILEAFAAWLRFGGRQVAQSMGAALGNHPLVSVALSGLQAGVSQDESPEQFDACVSACMELIWATVDLVTYEIVPDLQPLASALVQRAMGLLPVFTLARERAQAEVDQRDPDEDGGDDAEGLDDDVETVRSIARLFVEMGEAYCQLIATATPEAMGPVEALLQVVAHPSDRICAMSFDFWGRLTSAITGGRGTAGPMRTDTDTGMDDPNGGGGLLGSSNGGGGGGGGGGGAGGASVDVGLPMATGVELPPGVEVLTINRGGARTLPPNEVQRRLAAFGPSFERLVTLVRNRVRYPAAYSDMNRSERADFQWSRRAVVDVLIDANEVLGYARLLGLLLEPLEQLSQAVAQGSPFDWRAAEACLFCVRGVASCVPATADVPLLGQLLVTLPTLPREKELRYTAAQTVGAYADWVATREPAFVQNMLQLLWSLMPEAEVAGPAAYAVRRLCDAGRGKLGPLLPALLEMYNSTVGAGSLRPLLPAEQQANIPTSLVEEDVCNIVEGLAYVAASLDAAGSGQALAGILNPLMTSLRQCTELLSQGAAAPPAATQAMFGMLDRIDRVFKAFHGGDKRSAAQALEASWPLLSAVLAAAGSSYDLAEKVGKAVRYGLKCTGVDGAYLLGPILDSLGSAFAQYRYPVVMFVVSEVVKIFGREQQMVAPLSGILRSLVDTAAPRIADLRSFEALPDLSDDLYLLAGRCLHYCPGALASSGTIARLWAVAMNGALAQHRDANVSALRFLAGVMDPRFATDLARAIWPTGEAPGPSAERAVDEVRQLVASSGQEVTARLLGGAAGYLPGERMDELADVLQHLLKFTQGAAYDWVARALMALPEAAFPPADREWFMGQLGALAEKQRATGTIPAADVRDLLYSLADICRRHRKAQDQAIQALLTNVAFSAGIPPPPPSPLGPLGARQ